MPEHWNYKYPRLYTCMVGALAPVSWLVLLVGFVTAGIAFIVGCLCDVLEIYANPMKLTKYLWSTKDGTDAH